MTDGLCGPPICIMKQSAARVFADNPMRNIATDSAVAWWERFAQIQGVEVFHVDLSAGTAHESLALRFLNEWEHDRRNRFHTVEAQRRFALSRAALRSILCHALDCANEELEFGWVERGKPRASVDGVSAPLHFNVSHSSDHCLIAVSPDNPVGIDIEQLQQGFRYQAVMQSTFSADERGAVSAAGADDAARTFFEIWTLKEAIIKATGTGVSANVQSIEMPFEMLRGADTGSIRLPEFPDVCWQLYKLTGEDFVGALAVETV